MNMQHDFLDDDLRDQATLFVLESMPERESRVFRLHLRQCDVCRREVDSLTLAARDLTWLAPEETPRPEVWNRVLERIRREDPRTGPDRPQASASRNGASDGKSSDETGAPGDEAGALGDEDRAAPSSSSDSTEPSDASATPPDDAAQIWKGWAAQMSSSDRDPFTYLAAGQGRFEPTSMPGVEARRLFVDADHDRVTMLVRMAPGTSYPAHVHGGAEECLVISGDLRIGALHMRSGDFQRAEAGSTHVVQSTDEGCVLLIVSSLHDEML